MRYEPIDVIWNRGGIKQLAKMLVFLNRCVVALRDIRQLKVMWLLVQDSRPC